MEAPKRIAIDFDGVLCDEAFPAIGKVKLGAREVIRLFRQLGYRIVIWSCRTCHWDYEVYGGDPEEPTLDRQRVREMTAWLDTHGIEYDEVDDGSKGKPGAVFYIDDKAIRFEDNWPAIAEHVLRKTLENQVETYVKKEGNLIPFQPLRTGTIEPVDSGDPNGEGPFCA